MAGPMPRRQTERQFRPSEESVTTAIQNVETYLETFTEFQKQGAGHNLPWLRRLREDAFARFCETGFPTTHDEDWRFTNVSAIARTQFSLPKEKCARVSDSELRPWCLANAAARLVFVDGQFARELSEFNAAPANISVSSLKEEIADG